MGATMFIIDTFWLFNDFFVRIFEREPWYRFVSKEDETAGNGLFP